METKTAACPVCGGSEYYKECGFYFCSECQTQSQELREHVHEYYSTTRTSTRAKRNTNTEKEKSDGTNEWTSWEYYNFILKGLVDELIGLGAQKRVKIVVLQLWATYLKKLQVAFTSKKCSRLPKLGINYHPRDAELLYGCDVQERTRHGRKAFKRALSERARTTSSIISSYMDEHLAKLNLRKNKRALFEGEYEKDAKSSKHAMSEFDESMRSLETSSRGQAKSDDETHSTFPRLPFSYEARKLRSQWRRKYGFSPGRPIMNRNRSAYKFLNHSHPFILSRMKLLAILYIALRILQDDIQLSDILRWVEEGELSFYEVAHFFPDGVKLRGHDLVTFGPTTNKPSYSALCKMAKDLALYLRVTRLPAPDLLCLAKRYIEELQLPAEIVKYVEGVMTFSPPPMKFNQSLVHFFNYEGRAMAYVIFVLKLLLGLDGKTEYEISKVTKKLNELSEDSAGAARLFVWEEWMQYIECRKSVFARFHFPTQAAHYQDAFNSPNSFIKFWKSMKSRDDERHARLDFSACSKMNSELVNAVKRVLMKLIEEETDDDSAMDFVPSLMPQKANLAAILASKVLDLQCSATGIPSSADILKQDFTLATLEHLLNPDQYVAMANMKGIKVVVQERSAQNQVKQVSKMKTTCQSKGNKTYIIVDTMKNVPHCGQGEKQKRKLNEMRYKKHGVVVHDTDSSLDRLYHQSRISCNLPVIAEKMLVKHLRKNGLHAEVANLLRSRSDRTDVSCAESIFSSSEKESCPSTATKLFQHSEIFSNLPVVAEDMLVRHLEAEGISSELDGQLFHCSKEVDLPLAAKKVLLQHLKKCNLTENGVGKNNEFILYMPFVEYWQNEVNSKWQSLEEFEREVAVEFPPSFRWLITECAGMLRMTIQDLYYELLDVEDVCCLCRT